MFKHYLLSRRSGALVRVIAWRCIFGIGMGVAALVIVLSVMNGFNLTIRNRMLSIEPHLIVARDTRPTSSDLEQFTTLVKSFASVERVDRFENQDLILRTMEGVFGGAIAKGYDSSTLTSLLKRVGTKSSRPDGPSADLTTLAPNEMILGLDLARSLGVFEGDEVILVPPETLLLPKGEMPRLQKFKLRSMVSTQVPEVDSKLMFYNLSAGPSRFKSLSLETGYEIRLIDPYKAGAVQEQLLKHGFKSQSWMERDTSLFFALKMESYAMALFLSLAVLITSFSIVTVMVLLLNQKRRDIGMLMALGLTARRTQRVFLQVGLLLSFIGIVGGVTFGSTVALLLDWYPLELLPDIYTDSTLPAKLTWEILGFVLGASSVIAVLGSWLPSWRYVGSSPSDSLRKPAAANI